MTLDELLIRLPAVRDSDNTAAIRRNRLIASNTSLVVVDDDPTGTQTVHDIMVYMDWSVETLVRALSSDVPVFYLSTNSRALEPAEARATALEVGRNLKMAAEAAGRHLLVASRSDSTLRGYYPLEVDALIEGLGTVVDGVLLAPAFFEAGRHTIGDRHWVDSGTECLRADETEFAKDPTFGYTAQSLPAWVEEKTAGRWKADGVQSISLETIRWQGAEGVRNILMSLSGAAPVVVNAACYKDLEIIADGLAGAEARGKNYIYRCAASFVKVVGGFSDKPLLTLDQLEQRDGPGLIVAGSYIGKTSRQLASLAATGLTEAVELHVEAFKSEAGAREETAACAAQVNNLLLQGKTVTLHTSRTVNAAEGNAFLEFGKQIMAGLCGVVRSLTVQPSFLIAKGGITSLEVARTGLGIKEAFVKGQIAKGIAVWETGDETRWPHMDYVVFPGNVGDDDTLAEMAASLLSSQPKGDM